MERARITGMHAGCWTEASTASAWPTIRGCCPPCIPLPGLNSRHQLEDVGWQPSKLELEAQLGASRERHAELEWRLGQMEGLLRQHAALLQGQAAAPLGSLLDAIDDGHMSPPKQVCGGCAPRCTGSGG